MKFVDVANILVKAGDGGAGMSHFRREAFLPFGGPDGGNGGRGANIIFEGTDNMSTLLDFRFQRHYNAPPGGKGGTNQREGAMGEDLVLKVPCGTQVTDADTGELIGEVLHHGHRLLVAKGGDGGLGNKTFTNSRNQAPTKTQPAEHGQKRSLQLELKMIADVGIIGAPNAGKSTLITVISAARPKVADYPFTTLVPNLGVVAHGDAPPFVVADVPGLIPGASEGKGLGHDFLRHVERTRILIHLVDGSQETAEAMTKDFEGILKELELYDPELLKRPRLTVISKLDTYQPDEQEEGKPADELAQFRDYLKKKRVDYLEISSANRTGIKELLDRVVKQIDLMRDKGI